MSYITTREYAKGTSITQSAPWGLFTTATALCEDGKVRKVSRISETADTFFSVPASVRVKGRTVSGYITFLTLNENLSTHSDDDPMVVKFRAHSYGKNAHLLTGPSDVI